MVDQFRGVNFFRKSFHLENIGKSVLPLNLIRSLYAEANMPLHNKPHHNEILNVYFHQEDDICGRSRDITPIETPSRLYEFVSLRESLLPCTINRHIKDNRNCIILIQDIPPSVSHCVLSTCREISQNQSITDLYIERFHCDASQAVTNDVFNISKTAQSITVLKYQYSIMGSVGTFNYPVTTMQIPQKVTH